MTELERRITVLERSLASTQAELKRHERSRHAVSAPSLLASLVVCLALSLSVPLPASTQAQPPAEPRQVTRFDVPVVFMDGTRQVAEIGAGGLTISSGSNGRWIMGFTPSGAFILEAKEGAVSRVNLGRRGLTVFNDQGAPTFSGGATTTGSGELLLGNATGGTIVEAGMTNDGRGVVRVYPQGGPPPMVIPKTLMGGTAK